MTGEKLKTGPHLPWSFHSLTSLRAIGSLTILIPLSVVFLSNPQKMGLTGVLVFGSFFTLLSLFFINLTFAKVQCSADGVSQSYLFFHGKNLAWDKITKVDMAAGYRSGYALWIRTPAEKIGISVQIYPKKDILAFAELLQKKALKAQVEIDLEKIVSSYF